MSVMMEEYESSNPQDQARTIARLVRDEMFCPLCMRVGKWYYRFHESSSREDNSVRCSLHEITPIPGPSHYPDWEKATQLY
jgi:hypothetical protein